MIRMKVIGLTALLENHLFMIRQLSLNVTESITYSAPVEVD